MSKKDTDRLLGDDGYGATREGKKFRGGGQQSINGPVLPYLVMKESNHDNRIEALEVMVERLQAQNNILVDAGVKGLQDHAEEVKRKVPDEIPGSD